MRENRPAITEQMLMLSCLQCGASFRADQVAVAREARKFVYRCPDDGLELVRVGVGEFGKGGGNVGFVQGSARVKVGTTDVDYMEFLERDDSN